MTNPTHRSNPFTSLQIRGVLLVLFPAALFAAVAALTWPLTLKCHPDLGLYFRAAEHVAQGDLPYRDFGFAYPPLALIPCLVPLLFGWGDVSPEMFRWGFLFANAAYLTVIAWVIRSILTQETLDESAPLCVLALAAGILAPFLAWRYDLFPAMLTSLALLAAIRDRPMLCGGLLGLGISAKLYPIVLLPVIGLWFVKRSGVKPAFFFGLAALGGLGLTILPFLPDGLNGLVRVITFHSQRGVHVESFSGGVILLMNLLFGQTTPIGVSYGAWHIHSPAADALASLHGAFFVCLYGVFFLIASRRIALSTPTSRPAREMALLSLGALLVFVVSNKVLSPQYLAWLFPFVLFLRTKQSILLLAICSASIVIYPVAYNSLLRGEASAVILLNIRNGLLLMLFLSLLMDLSEEPIREGMN